ncbi:hypothetical protein XO10_00905 [Marinitoga sp. 1135]|uniref:Organic solvent tolerance protein OstA n=1 Tax=Marinitoga piezophila (strain DSM 14283 / JCM 11233 / KA3) TaxID=443254 RepID=H2J361_MARPK|nr:MULTISPECIES: LptA/OstA family protein [Marinitoga]AEX84579.1 organic solvent tolerance protein OstA [Marinitoga piezophila KA3]APT75099.1 hypothetical protein LN42_00845 [Marinitoga sp. 1137]NUU94872.1 hypothetical protein [Marinitoga sp. 1135]NUU96810.1 hypothetical protein [Marinitoga sp. 1138]
MKKWLFLLISVLLFSIALADTIHVSAITVNGGDDFYVLKNDVKVIKNDLEVLTDLATVTLVNEEWRNLESSGDIFIKTDTMEATSNLLKYDLKKDIGTLSGDVETTIKLKEDNKIIYIFCDKIEFNNKDKTYSGNMKSDDGLVKILKDDYVIFAKSFEYDENTKILVLKDNVTIKNDVKKINMKTSKATFKTDKNEISAQRVQLTLEIKNDNEKEEEENK